MTRDMKRDIEMVRDQLGVSVYPLQAFERICAALSSATPAGGGLTELIAKWRRHAKNMRIDGLMDCADELEATLAASPVPMSDTGAQEKCGDCSGCYWGTGKCYGNEQAAPPQSAPVAGMTDKLEAEVARLNAIINSPQSDDFIRAVSTEAEHQRQRWGAEGDAGKTPADWFWLIGYLAGKALHSHASGNVEKAEHHVITTAAACANWHRAIFGKSDMRPGIDKAALRETQGGGNNAR